MKNLIKFGIFVFVVLVTTNTVFATDYNYLPPDVLIKQQEEKSALEYRLQKLESGLSGNSSLMISTLSSRISQLEQERDTEKNYISGVYSSYGIGNQLQSKLAQIDAKYNSQISALRSQKADLENKASSQQSQELEIAELKLQIAKLKDQIAEQEYKASQQALLKYQEKHIYTDSEVQEIFNYLDALTVQDASNLHQKIRRNNPEVADRLEALHIKKYPNGKPGTAKYADYLATLKPVKPSVTTPSKTESKTQQKQEVKKIEQTTTDIIPAVVINEEKPVIAPPVQEKQTFGTKIKNFFKRWFR